MRSRAAIITVILAIFFIFSGTDLMSQCAMCKQAAESSLDSNPRSMARNLNSGILYLMAAPYLLIAFIFRKQIFQLFRKIKGRFSRITAQ